jgi:hypothetical protein
MFIECRGPVFKGWRQYYDDFIASPAGAAAGTRLDTVARA